VDIPGWNEGFENRVWRKSKAKVEDRSEGIRFRNRCRKRQMSLEEIQRKKVEKGSILDNHQEG
jgi:hypothetical protein